HEALVYTTSFRGLVRCLSGQPREWRKTTSRACAGGTASNESDPRARSDVSLPRSWQSLSLALSHIRQTAWPTARHDRNCARNRREHLLHPLQTSRLSTTYSCGP